MKKSGKIILLIVIIAVACVGVFFGIQSKQNSENKIEELENQIAKLEGNNDTKNEAEATVETENETKNETLTEDEMYKSIISDYKKASSEYDENDIDSLEKIEAKYSMVNSTIIDLAARYNNEGAKMKYVLYDIDKNGIKELIVGIAYDTGNDFSAGAVYAYNTDAKKAEKIYYQDTMERGNLYIYDNGILFADGSGGSTLHYYEFGKIGNDGYSYEELEGIEEEYTEESSNPVYRDFNTSTVLNYKSLDEIKNKYLNNSNTINFSDYFEI